MRSGATVRGTPRLLLPHGRPAGAANRRHAAAESQLEQLDSLRCADAAGKLRTQILRTRTSIFLDRQDAKEQALETLRIAAAQRTRPGRHLAGRLVRLASRESIDDWVTQGEVADEYCWSLLAEDIVANLDQLGPVSMERVRAEAELRPLRWRSALRQAIVRGSRASGPAAVLLADVGSGVDAAFLRTAAATRRSLRPSALAITQRLAQSVFVSDLGVIEVRIGAAVVPRGAPKVWPSSATCRLARGWPSIVTRRWRRYGPT